MPYERQILLSRDPVPRRSWIFLSACAHLVVLVLIVALRHVAGPQVVPEELETAEIISGQTHIAYSPPVEKTRQPNASPLQFPRRTRRTQGPSSPTGLQGAALARMRGRAKAATSGMIESFKAKQFWGFSTEHFDLAAQTAGQLPVISAYEVPPHYEQYVTVEVTIDEEGRVADARVISGEVSRDIQHKLLAAVREFRYSPARHDGTPIPSQLDIVVHIPS
ncbi:MAG TPA: energy transducer TonB [Candidatus Angelobacter sp.]|jgi:TonB family protein|nr:energy transducer TonB [Candidatus Angelobacter sp.]